MLSGKTRDTYCNERKFTFTYVKPKLSANRAHEAMQRISDIDLRLLRVFVAVAEAHGFAAAESYLNVSTSTISVHISNLEKRLGIRLCERGRSGFKLTEQGRIVYQETKGILKSLDDFSGALANIKSKLAGRLSIGLSDALITHPDFSISEAVRRFNEIDNDVEIELVIAPKQDLESDVVEGRIHAAIGPFLPKKPGLSLVLLYRETHDIYCGLGHPLFDTPQRAIAKADLSAFPAVVRSYAQDFDRDHLGVVREDAMANTIEGLLSLLLSGNYIGYLPDHFAAKWVEDGRLARVPTEGLSYDSRHGMITKSGSRASLALETFIALVKDIAAARTAEAS